MSTNDLRMTIPVGELSDADPELRCIAACWYLLNSLDSDQRRRVMRFLSDRMEEVAP